MPLAKSTNVQHSTAGKEIPGDVLFVTNVLDCIASIPVPFGSLPIHFSTILFLLAVSLFELLVAGLGGLGNAFALLAYFRSWPGLQDHLSQLVEG